MIISNIEKIEGLIKYKTTVRTWSWCKGCGLGLDASVRKPCPKCGGIFRHFHDFITESAGGK